MSTYKKPIKAQLVPVERGLLYAFLLILVVICVTPFFMMLVNATRSAAQINSGFTLIPSSHFMENLNSIKEQANINLYNGLKNSAIIAFSATVLTAYFSSLTAYGFQFYNFKGKNFLFAMILLMMMVPQQLGMLGFYTVSAKLGMLNTFYPLIIPSVANIFGVFFIRQYMASVIHMSLIEAARIDGASEITIFHKIIFPLIVPATATITIMAFIANWNNYLGPLLILQTNNMKTIPLLIGSLKGARVAQNNYGALYAAIALSIIPILIIFVIFSRYIISGISSGGVKE
jgi:multiple sugar transport system permease protein